MQTQKDTKSVSGMTQEWFDENRDLFKAETAIAEKSELKKCKHYFKRTAANFVSCITCNAMWMDNGEWRLKDGNVVSIERKS